MLQMWTGSWSFAFVEQGIIKQPYRGGNHVLSRQSRPAASPILSILHTIHTALRDLVPVDQAAAMSENSRDQQVRASPFVTAGIDHGFLRFR